MQFHLYQAQLSVSSKGECDNEIIFCICEFNIIYMKMFV